MIRIIKQFEGNPSLINEGHRILTWRLGSNGRLYWKTEHLFYNQWIDFRDNLALKIDLAEIIRIADEFGRYMVMV